VGPRGGASNARPARAVTALPLRVEGVSTEEGFLRLRGPWEALTREGAGGTPFQAWAVTYHAWKMEAAGLEPLILVARNSEGAVEGILPFGVRSGRSGPFTWRALQTIGPQRLDFVDVIAPPGRARPVLEAFIGWLSAHASSWDELLLTPIRGDALLMAHLKDLPLPRGLELGIDAVGENMALVIPRGARGWEDVCNGHHCRSTRRIVKRLEGSGFEVRKVTEGYPLATAVAALASVHARRRAELGHTSLLAATERQQLCALADAAVRDGGDLMVMEHEDVPVAVQLTLRLGERVSHYRVAFNSDYRNWSPGIGLLVAAVDAAVKSGAREYDFGLGTEEYKRRWSQVRRTVYTVRLSNSHVSRAPRRLWSLASRSVRRLRRVWRPRRAGAST